MAAADGGLISPLADSVRCALADHRPVDSIVVALGGGADSACLLAAAREAFEGSVVGVFVDHRLPQSAALRQAALAAGRAADVDVVIVDGRVQDGPDLERRARDIRYEAIEREVDERSILMTGHTEDDQAETVLMRLAQGAGTTGLAGIPDARGRWVRPLLHWGKADLRRIADGVGLPYVDDPANGDTRFLRSRVRHRVVPVLEAELGVHARGGLARSAALLTRDDAFLGDVASRIPVLVVGDTVQIPVAPLVTESIVVASRACRRALRIVGDGYPGTSADVDAMLEVARTGTQRSLTGGASAARVGPFLRLGAVQVPAPVALPVGGTVAWHGATYRLVEDRPGPVVEGGRFTVLDRTVVGEGIVLRGARDGDRIDIGVGSTPVAELLRVHGVAAADRPVSPVAEMDGKIGAVVGVRTAAWAVPSDRGRRVIIEREVGT